MIIALSLNLSDSKVKMWRVTIKINKKNYKQVILQLKDKMGPKIIFPLVLHKLKEPPLTIAFNSYICANLGFTMYL